MLPEFTGRGHPAEFPSSTHTDSWLAPSAMLDSALWCRITVFVLQGWQPWTVPGSSAQRPPSASCCACHGWELTTLETMGAERSNHSHSSGPGSTSAPMGLRRTAAMQPITNANSYSHAKSCDLFANLPAVGVFSKSELTVI